MMLHSEIKAILQTNTSLPTINCCISPGKTLHFGKDWGYINLESELCSLYHPTQVGKYICSLPLHHCCKWHCSGMASVAHRVWDLEDKSGYIAWSSVRNNPKNVCCIWASIATVLNRGFTLGENEMDDTCKSLVIQECYIRMDSLSKSV